MKTCIITGASSGIGQAVAIEISQREDYHNIVLLARDEEKLDITSNQMNKNKNIIKIKFDLEDLYSITTIVKNIVDECGSIDCLLNIAGYTDPQFLLTTTIENFQKTYAINVFSPFILIRECVKHMKNNANGGKILNVASTAGITPRPGWLSYASSKASMISMSQTLSEELAEYNIKVYCVSPGRCATALRKKLAPDEDQTKIMQPEEVAKIISDLVSEKENCLDGQNIIIRKRI
jgi:3-oxoacyl-[acyl-carrier protein] reductase